MGTCVIFQTIYSRKISSLSYEGFSQVTTQLCLINLILINHSAFQELSWSFGMGVQSELIVWSLFHSRRIWCLSIFSNIWFLHLKCEMSSDAIEQLKQATANNRVMIKKNKSQLRDAWTASLTFQRAKKSSYSPQNIWV